MSGVDPRASSAFGAAAAEYARLRPSYPVDAIDRLAAEFRLGPDSRVLDLGAGTGKLSRLLPGRVVAVEPVDAMRAAIPAEIEALAGTAQDIPLPDGSVDAVFVADAFHWFDLEPSAREIARVLVAGGGFAILFHEAEWEGPWVERFRELIRPTWDARGPLPIEEGDWRDRLAALELFEPLREENMPQVERLDAPELPKLVDTWSPVRMLPEAERHELLDQVGELVAGETTLELRYRVDVFWTRRLGG